MKDSAAHIAALRRQIRESRAAHKRILSRISEGPMSARDYASTEGEARKQRDSELSATRELSDLELRIRTIAAAESLNQNYVDGDDAIPPMLAEVS